jgi:hypothetical protein
MQGEKEGGKESEREREGWKCCDKQTEKEIKENVVSKAEREIRIYCVKNRDRKGK